MLFVHNLNISVKHFCCGGARAHSTEAALALHAQRPGFDSRSRRQRDSRLIISTLLRVRGQFKKPETVEVNIQLDSHVGGDIYRPMHPLRTFVAFHKLRTKNFKWQKETA